MSIYRGILGFPQNLNPRVEELTPNGGIVREWRVNGQQVRGFDAQGYEIRTAANEGSFGFRFPLYRAGGASVDFMHSGGVSHQLRINGISPFQITTGGQFQVIGSLGFSAGAALGPDVQFFRDAANTLAQRNGTNTQTWRLYETFTDASNGAWFQVQATGARYEIGGRANGTGVVRPVMVQHGTVTVANLPAAATAGAGARMVVSDATARTFGDPVTGGGALVCPVFSDGTAWRMG